MGMPIPNRIQNAPVLIFGLGMFLTGFLDLTGSRQGGMGPGPIAWGTVQDYCHVIGLDAEQTEDMHYHIRCMDTVWLEHQRSKEGKDSG